MTSIQQFNFVTAMHEIRSQSYGPPQAQNLLADLQTAYAKDVAQYGEAAVKASSSYPQLTQLQGELAQAAASAVNRSKRGGLL
jgi:hypothetical protein